MQTFTDLKFNFILVVIFLTNFKVENKKILYKCMYQTDFNQSLITNSLLYIFIRQLNRPYQSYPEQTQNVS